MRVGIYHFALAVSSALAVAAAYAASRYHFTAVEWIYWGVFTLVESPGLALLKFTQALPGSTLTERLGNSLVAITINSLLYGVVTFALYRIALRWRARSRR